MNNQTLGIVAIVAGIGIFAFTALRPGGQRPRPYYPPPPPPDRPGEVQGWIDLIFNLYGKGKELWEPGGPFHRDSVPAGVNPDLLPKYDDYA